MTTVQIKKTVWLNRLYYIKLKLDCLYSLKESDRKHAQKLMEMIPDKNDPKLSEECGKIIDDSNNSNTEKYMEILNLYNNVKNEIFSAIDVINDFELQAILISHYLEYKPWNVVASEKFYSLRTVKYKHLKALDLLNINESEFENA